MLTVIARSDLKLWFLAIRPLTLPLSVTPVLVGAVLASLQQAGLNWPLLLVTLTAAISIQAGTNLLNDAEDFERGNDTMERRGPPRVTARGWATASEVKVASSLSFLLAALCGLYLIGAGGWPIFWIGLFSILAGIAYSAGPLPISHTPLGEMFVFLFFGIVPVIGTVFLQTGEWTLEALLSGAAMGAYAAAVLHTNNARDIDEDVKAGRHTLAILIAGFSGKSKGHGNRLGLSLVYGLFVLLPYIFLVLQSMVSGWISIPEYVWLVLLSLPGALLVIRYFYEAQTASQSNRLLVMTIGLQLLFATLFGLGLLV